MIKETMFKKKRKLKDYEECWVLKGQRGHWAWNARYDRYTDGLPASVVFDPDYVWDNRNKVIGFMHTHPHWSAYPSGTDDITMKALVCSLGKPLLCCILGLDGLRAHWYMDDESKPIETKVIKIGGKIYGLNP